MQIIEKNKFYFIYFIFSTKIENAIRMIPGREFDHSKKVWKVPVNDTSRKHIKDFAERFDIAIEEPVQKELERNNKAIPMPTLDMTDEELSKMFKLTPRDYQKAGIAYGLKQQRFINGDAPGLGKTAQSICTVMIANRFPCLVICPSGLKNNWKQEWEMWTNKKAMILNNANRHTWHMMAQGQSLFGQGPEGMAQVFITNYESLNKYFVSRIDKPTPRTPLKLIHIKFHSSINLFKSVIIDESHRVKDITAQRTKLTKGVSHGKPYIIELTGTPIVNKTEDLASQLGIIEQLDKFGGYKYFKDRYCKKKKSESNLDELNYLMNKHCFFRREKKDVMKELPDKTRQIVLCDIINRKEYNDALADLEVYLKQYRQASDEQIKRSMKGEVMVRIGVLKNIAARGKLNDVCEYISDIIESGEKIVVFIYLKEVAYILKKIFPNALMYTGSENDRQKNDAIQKFQECKTCKVRFERHSDADHEFAPSDYPLIFVNYKAGGVGITLTAASIAGVVEFPWHAADTDQLEDRLHRMSQKNAVQIAYFLAKNTFDVQSYKIIEEKRELGNAITGAKNDVEVSVMDSLINLLMKHKKEAVR